MTPEYLRELADLADPDKLWTLGAFEQLDLPPEKRRQLDAGIALRRHAAHVNDLLGLLGTGKSLLLTPLSENGTAIMTTRTPAAHRKLVECRKKPNTLEISRRPPADGRLDRPVRPGCRSERNTA